MRRKPQPAIVIPPEIVLHESVPEMAFELALFRMQHTTDSTHNILNDYLRELGA